MNLLQRLCGICLLLIAGCADLGSSGDGGGSETIVNVPGTAIESRSSLAYAVGQLRIYAKSKYDCSALVIENARRLSMVGDKGEFAEEWEADVCGAQKRFTMSFVHDMTGGLVLTIRE
jgi:hypothetical protein